MELVCKCKELFYLLLHINNTLCIIGDTGCGKTTFIPKILYEILRNYKEKKLLIIQNKRIIAINSSIRLSNIVKEDIGISIGFKIKYFNYSSNLSKIIFSTECKVLMELLNDFNLSVYSYIVIDEYHDRTIYSDLIIGVLKAYSEKSMKISKLLIMTATIDYLILKKIFPEIKILFFKGILHKKIVYFLRKSLKNYIIGAYKTFFKYVPMKKILSYEKNYNILIFLTGKIEILLLKLLIKSSYSSIYSNHSIKIVAVYSSLLNFTFSANKRLKKQKKITLFISTNIAETSLTIQNLKYIIDCGYVKISLFDNRSNLTYLKISSISKMQSKQRTGRIGRIHKGIVFKLFSKKDFNKLSSDGVDNIRKHDFTNFLLYSLLLGIKNIATFDYLLMPSLEEFVKALIVLELYNMLDATNMHITSIGRVSILFPLNLNYAKIIIEASLNRCNYNFIKSIIILSVKEKLKISIFLNEVINQLDNSYLSAINQFIVLDLISTHIIENYSNRLLIHFIQIEYGLLKYILKIYRHIKKIMYRVKIPLFKSQDLFIKKLSLVLGNIKNIALLINFPKYVLPFHNLAISLKHPNYSLFKIKPYFNKSLTYYYIDFFNSPTIQILTCFEIEWLAFISRKYFLVLNKRVD